MTPITLTAQQAAELHTTGRLSYREKCEWQPPKYAKYKRIINGKTLRYRWLEEFHEVTLTPPRDTDTTYAVWKLWEQWSMADPTDMHARVTDRKLIISDGELWWDMDLEKVAK